MLASTRRLRTSIAATASERYKLRNITSPSGRSANQWGKCPTRICVGIGERRVHGRVEPGPIDVRGQRLIVDAIAHGPVVLFALPSKNRIDDVLFSRCSGVLAFGGVFDTRDRRDLLSGAWQDESDGHE